MQPKNMYLVYIDESYDEEYFAYSALFVPAFEWREVFNEIYKWRYELFERYGIETEYELHSTKFVRGEGEPRKIFDKHKRAQMFNSFFKVFDNTAGLSVINGISFKHKRHALFEYMLNRIDRALTEKNAYGILICDEGDEKKLVSIQRRMRINNHIQYQANTDEITIVSLNRIIEDPLFKTSDSSFFIQITDMMAYALLRSEHPTPTTLPDVKNSFDNLDKILNRKAFSRDHKQKGIVRI